MLRAILFAVSLLMVQQPSQALVHRRVLLIEHVGNSLQYVFQGKRLDPDHVFAEIPKLLPRELEADSELFVLLGPSITLDQAFDLGSALSMRIGFKNVRYFSFSREARRMQEISLHWDRYVFSVDGSLQKAEY